MLASDSANDITKLSDYQTFFLRETIRLLIMAFGPIKSQSVSIKFLKHSIEVSTFCWASQPIFFPHHLKTFSLFSFHKFMGVKNRVRNILCCFKKQL